jgi:hypothetical protein
MVRIGEDLQLDLGGDELQAWETRIRGRGFVAGGLGFRGLVVGDELELDGAAAVTCFPGILRFQTRAFSLDELPTVGERHFLRIAIKIHIHIWYRRCHLSIFVRTL